MSIIEGDKEMSQEIDQQIKHLKAEDVMEVELTDQQQQEKDMLVAQSEAQQITQPQSMESILEQRKKEVEDFKANKDNQAKAFGLAKAFIDVLGNKWTTLPRASRKVKETEMIVFQKIKLLELFNLCTIKRGDPDNIDQRGKLVFKIHVELENELAAIDDIIGQLRNELTQMLSKRNDILAKIDQTKPSPEN